jgi:hypothetical protein
MSVVRVPFQDAYHLLTVLPVLPQPNSFPHVRLRHVIELSEIVNAALVRNLLAGSVQGTIRDFDAALKVLQLGDCLAPTGSVTWTNTTGTLRVACCNGIMDETAAARMTSGASATNSAACLRMFRASPPLPKRRVG